MTTEETELVFVRCPNCRSLALAAATRCKMCGHQLGKGEGEAADDAAQRKSRVRQRTISATRDDVEEIKKQILSGALNEAEPEHGADEDDDRIRVGGSRPARPEIRVSAPNVAAPNITPNIEEPKPANGLRAKVFEQDDEPLEDDEVDTTYLRTDAPHSERAPKVSASVTDVEDKESDPAPKSVVDWHSDEDDAHVEDEGDEDDDGGDEPLVGASEPPLGGQREGKRKRRRKKKKPSQLANTVVGAGSSAIADGAPPSGRTEPPPVVPPVVEPKVEQHVEPRVEARVESRIEPRIEPRVEPRVEPVAVEPVVPRTVTPEAQGSSESKGFGNKQVGQVMQTPNQPRGADASQSFRGRAVEEAEGTLLGWFIHFGQDPRGMSVEVRSGRFFLGRQKLRASDMVIADSTVSTPHCLITSSAQDGITIQDLMSEQGTFIKRARSDSYAPVQQVMTLEHGDWVRFGQYEVMVCLVPYSAKQ